MGHGKPVINGVGYDSTYRGEEKTQLPNLFSAISPWKKNTLIYKDR